MLLLGMSRKVNMSIKELMSQVDVNRVVDAFLLLDYRFYERKPTKIDGDWVARWKKYYHRK